MKDAVCAGIRACLIAFMVVLLGVFSWSDTLVSIYSNGSACYLSRALANRSTEQEQLQRSLEFSKKALQVRPDSISAARSALRAVIGQGESSLASLPFEVSEVLAEGDSIAALYLGKLMWDSGSAEQAMEIWRSIEDVEYYFMNLGDQAYAEGNIDSALNGYEISLAINDKRSGQKRQMYTNLCEYETSQGNLESAISWCSRAVQVGRNVWTLVRLGHVHRRAGDYDTALAVFEQARDLDSDVMSVYYELCLAYRALGELGLALQNCERGLSLASTDQFLNLVAGDLYAQAGEADKAFCCYLQVVEHASEERLVSQAREKFERQRDIIPVPTRDTR